MIEFGQLTFAALADWLVTQGFKKGHARTLWKKFYRFPGTEPDSTPEIPDILHIRLGETFDFTSPLKVEQIVKSLDGSQKFLFRSRDEHLLESVFIPQENRKTLCLSSQLGCPWACRFCATGAIGFGRNLSAAEIVGQVMEVQRVLGTRITNLVFMGMGEPLCNLENLQKSLAILSHPLGLCIAPRRTTLSTIGVLPAIEEMIAKRWPFQLAISLHHPEQGKREELMPGTVKHGLGELIALLRRYTVELNRLVFFEYLLLNEVNDSLEHAQALVSLLAGIPCRVNLIRFHPFEGSPFQPTPAPRENEFYQYLQKSKIAVFCRKSRGQDIGAACGQLAGRQVQI